MTGVWNGWSGDLRIVHILIVVGQEAARWLLLNIEVKNPQVYSSILLYSFVSWCLIQCWKNFTPFPVYIRLIWTQMKIPQFFSKRSVDIKFSLKCGTCGLLIFLFWQCFFCKSIKFQPNYQQNF